MIREATTTVFYLTCELCSQEIGPCPGLIDLEEYARETGWQVHDKGNSDDHCPPCWAWLCEPISI